MLNYHRGDEGGAEHYTFNENVSKHTEEVCEVLLHPRLIHLPPGRSYSIL